MRSLRPRTIGLTVRVENLGQLEVLGELDGGAIVVIDEQELGVGALESCGGSQASRGPSGVTAQAA